MLFFLKKWLWGKVRQMLWGKVRHCGERSNPGKTVPIYQITGLLNEAFLSAVTPRNITSGCRSNRDIFPEEAFAPYPWCQTGQILSCSLHPLVHPLQMIQVVHPLQMIRMVHALQMIHPLQMIQKVQSLQMNHLPLPKCPPRAQNTIKRE